jgi:hypothetical protein
MKGFWMIGTQLGDKKAPGKTYNEPPGHKIEAIAASPLRVSLLVFQKKPELSN